MVKIDFSLQDFEDASSGKNDAKIQKVNEWVRDAVLPNFNRQTHHSQYQYFNVPTGLDADFAVNKLLSIGLDVTRLVDYRTNSIGIKFQVNIRSGKGATLV